MRIKKISAVIISLMLLTALSGCVSLVRGPVPSPTPPRILSLDNEVKLVGGKTPAVGTTGIYPTGWGVGESTQNSDGTVTPGGEITSNHILLFSKDKTCAFEVTHFFTDANTLQRGDLFETKTLLYSQASTANSQIKNESTDYVSSNEGKIEFVTATVPNAVKGHSATAYSMVRVFGTKVSDSSGQGFPVIQGIYSCSQGTNVDAKVWAGLIQSVKLTI